MSEQLAMRGGAAVRDIAVRPWPAWPAVSEGEWRERVEPALREVYLSGIEGLPGPRAEVFARRFADSCDARHGRLVKDGTNAISASLAAVLDLDGWQDGGEILLPDYTFISTASSPLELHCAIRFVDIDRDSFTMDVNALEQAIDPERTRAILVVHLGGHPADMARINGIAERHGIAVIEDCAQAHGARCCGRSVGAIGAIGAFSFQSSKNLTCGEGGAVVTDSADLMDRITSFQDVGRVPTGKRWEYHRIGWNYRASEYLAALLDVRLDDLEGQTERRRANAEYLSAQLQRVPGITPPRVLPFVDRHAYHIYAILVEPAAFGGAGRDLVLQALQAEGIPASAGYTVPLSKQPALRSMAAAHPQVIAAGGCPNTEWVCGRSVWLPQHVLLAERKDMDDIATALAKIQKLLT